MKMCRFFTLLLVLFAPCLLPAVDLVVAETEQVLPAPLPSSEEVTQSYEGAFTKMLVTLLGLVALVFATFWILRRLGRGKFHFSSSKTIQILERRPLSPKSMLYVVEFDGQRFLISESQLEVRALTVYKNLSEEE